MSEAARAGDAATAPATGGFVYLASASPRRSRLLTQIGVAHRLLLAEGDEDAEAIEAERPGEAPRAYVERVARDKLTAALGRLSSRGLPQAPVLCADTVVSIGRRVFGKPRDAADAAAILAALSGRTHRVVTAVALAWGVERRSSAVTSRVRFAAIDAASIDRYVASGEPFGKAGAYAVQGTAAAWIERISGSYTAIMGLPLHETAILLREAGIGTAP